MSEQAKHDLAIAFMMSFEWEHHSLDEWIAQNIDKLTETEKVIASSILALFDGYGSNELERAYLLSVI